MGLPGIILKREFVHLFLPSVCRPPPPRGLHLCVCILFYRLKSQASNYRANDFFSLGSLFSGARAHTGTYTHADADKRELGNAARAATPPPGCTVVACVATYA